MIERELMSKVEKDAPVADVPRAATIHIAARERTVPRWSAAYVYAGGKGEAAYKLIGIIEGHDKRFSERAGKNPFLSKWKITELDSGNCAPRQFGLGTKPTMFKWKIFGGGLKKKSA
jgi:hypothetical protein